MRWAGMRQQECWRDIDCRRLQNTHEAGKVRQGAVGIGNASCASQLAYGGTPLDDECMNISRTGCIPAYRPLSPMTSHVAANHRLLCSPNTSLLIVLVGTICSSGNVGHSSIRYRLVIPPPQLHNDYPIVSAASAIQQSFTVNLSLFALKIHFEESRDPHRSSMPSS